MSKFNKPYWWEGIEPAKVLEVEKELGGFHQITPDKLPLIDALKQVGVDPNNITDDIYLNLDWGYEGVQITVLQIVKQPNEDYDKQLEKHNKWKLKQAQEEKKDRRGLAKNLKARIKEQRQQLKEQQRQYEKNILKLIKELKELE